MSDEDITTATDDDTEAVADAEDNTDATGTGDAGEAGEQEPEGSGELGDKGKRALESMKGKWRAERDRRKGLEARIAELEAAQGGDGKAEEQTPEQIAAEAEKAALGKANARILRSEVKAAAAGKLTDPTDALLHLDLDKFEVDADGGVDEDEIAEAITDLLKRKPYLAVAQGGQRFEGTADGGRRGQKKPTVDQQIAEAQAAGDWKTVMHLNNQKLAAAAAGQK